MTATTPQEIRPTGDEAALRCPACNGASLPTRLVVEARYRLRRCAACRTQFLRDERQGRDGGETASDYWEQYKLEVYGDRLVREEYAARYADQLARVRSVVGDVHEVLDVGCGLGGFVEWAEQHGMSARGVELDGDVVARAQQLGLAVFGPEQLDEQVPAGSLDLLTAWDVLEHVHDPLPLLRTYVDRLRPGGALLIEVPDGAFPLRRAVLAAHAATGGRLDLTGPLYYWEHKTYFTLAGLTALLSRAGCQVRASHREPSPRAKLDRGLARMADEQQVPGARSLRRTWRAAAGPARALHVGNKLLVIAVKLPLSAPAAQR